MILSSIVAVSENDVIGKEGDLPWHLPADLKRFKSLTMGHAIVMGRRTFESIGRLLPGRETVILTRAPQYPAPAGARVVHSLAEAREALADDDEVFVIGGEAIFRLALPESQRLYLTRVHARVDGDVYFPANGLKGWTLVSDELHLADERHAYAFSFRLYERL